MSYHDPNTIITSAGCIRRSRALNDVEHVTVKRGEMDITFTVKEKRGNRFYTMDHDDDEGADYESLSAGMLARKLSTPENTSAMEYKRVRFP